MLVIASAHRSGRVLEERDESGFMLFSELIKHIGGGVTVMESRLASDPSINRVCEDSRKVQRGDLFVARSGTKTSGAQFAADALSKGAAAIISAPTSNTPHVNRRSRFLMTFLSRSHGLHDPNPSVLYSYITAFRVAMPFEQNNGGQWTASPPSAGPIAADRGGPRPLGW